MRLMNVQSSISAANLDAALATVRALFAGEVEKRQEPSPGLLSVSIPSTIHCSAMWMFSSTHPDPTLKQMKVVCTNVGQSRYFALNNTSSFTRTSPWRQPDLTHRVIPVPWEKTPKSGAAEG